MPGPKRPKWWRRWRERASAPHLSKTSSTQHLVQLAAHSSCEPLDEWSIGVAVPALAAPASLLRKRARSARTARLRWRVALPDLAINKAWYLTVCGALALYPYLNLFLKERGLTAVQIGGLLALRPWLAALAGE